MLILGADPEQLEGLAVSVRNHANYYEEIRLDIARVLRGIGWEGPDAELFRNRYDSRIAPAISGAADHLRTAESCLLGNAAEQRRTSSIVLITCRGIPIDAGPGAQDGPEAIWDYLKRNPWFLIPGGPLLFGIYSWVQDTIDPINHIVNFAADLGLEWADIKLSDGAFGIAGRVLSGFAAAYGIMNLPKDFNELRAAIEAGDPAEIIYQGTDIGLTAAAIVGVFFPPAGLITAAAMYGAKLGTWIYENRDAIAETFSQLTNAAYDFGVDIIDRVENLADTAGDFVGDVADAAGDFVDDVTESLGDTARKVGGWLNPFD